MARSPDCYGKRSQNDDGVPREVAPMKPLRKVDRKIAALAALLLIALGLSLLVPHLSTPRHQSRPVQSWFKEYCSTNGATEASRQAFLAMGPRSVPFLTRQLTNDAPIPTPLTRVLEYVSAKLFKTGPTVVRIPFGSRVSAARLLGELGPAARSGVPALIAALSVRDPMYGWTGPGPSPAGWATTFSPAFRLFVTEALEKIDLEAPGVEEALVVAMKEDEERTGCVVDFDNPISRLIGVVSEAAHALEKIKAPRPHTIVSLLEALEAMGRGHRWQCIMESREWKNPERPPSMGSADPRRDLLTSLLKGEHAGVVAAAAFELRYQDGTTLKPGSNLKMHGRLTAPAIEGLVRLLGNQWVRIDAAETLCVTGSVEPQTYVPALIEELRERQSWDRLRAIEILRHCGAAAEPALPLLRERMADPVGFVAVWAKKAVGEIEAVPKPQTPGQLDQN